MEILPDNHKFNIVKSKKYRGQESNQWHKRKIDPFATRQSWILRTLFPHLL